MKRLISKAKAARMKAYAPYSKFKVGAALQTKDGKIYTGCNVENASYGATCCAERNAVAAAVASGQKKFWRIAIVADTAKPCPPCGICRQVLHEFSEDMEVIMATVKGKVEVMKLNELLPRAFRKNAM